MDDSRDAEQRKQAQAALDLKLYFNDKQKDYLEWFIDSDLQQETLWAKGDKGKTQQKHFRNAQYNWNKLVEAGLVQKKKLYIIDSGVELSSNVDWKAIATAAKANGFGVPLPPEEGAATVEKIRKVFEVATEKDIVVYSGHTHINSGALMGAGRKPIERAEIKKIILNQKRSPGILILGGCYTARDYDYMFETYTTMIIGYSGMVDKRAENGAATTFLERLFAGDTLKGAAEKARKQFADAQKALDDISMRDPETKGSLIYKIADLYLPD